MGAERGGTQGAELRGVLTGPAELRRVGAGRNLGGAQAGRGGAECGVGRGATREGRGGAQGTLLSRVKYRRGAG